MDLDPVQSAQCCALAYACRRRTRSRCFFLVLLVHRAPRPVLAADQPGVLHAGYCGALVQALQPEASHRRQPRKGENTCAAVAQANDGYCCSVNGAFKIELDTMHQRPGLGALHFLLCLARAPVSRDSSLTIYATHTSVKNTMGPPLPALLGLVSCVPLQPEPFACVRCMLMHVETGQLDFPEFGRNLEEFMAKKGTPVKRVVMSKEGLSHVVSEVPGPDYPEVNPYLITREEDDGLLPERFDGTSLLPGAHVGGASFLPGGLPPAVGGGAGAGGGEAVVDGGEEGKDAAAGGDETGS